MTAEASESSRDPRRIAVHEMGHALAAIICGVRVRDVNLVAPNPTVPDDKWMGWTNYDGAEVDPAKASTIKMAGGVAEELIFGNVQEGSCVNDHLGIRQLLNDDQERIYETARHTKELLQPHADILTLLAQQLMTWRILTGEGINEILKGRRRPAPTIGEP